MRASGAGSLLFTLLQQAQNICLLQLLRRRCAKVNREGPARAQDWQSLSISHHGLGTQGCILRVPRGCQDGAWQITIDAGMLLSFALSYMTYTRSLDPKRCRIGWTCIVEGWSGAGAKKSDVRVAGSSFGDVTRCIDLQIGGVMVLMSHAAAHAVRT